MPQNNESETIVHVTLNTINKRYSMGLGDVKLVIIHQMVSNQRKAFWAWTWTLTWTTRSHTP